MLGRAECVDAGRECADEQHQRRGERKLAEHRGPPASTRLGAGLPERVEQAAKELVAEFGARVNGLLQPAEDLLELISHGFLPAHKSV
jgi:hypothetical protein